MSHNNTIVEKNKSELENTPLKTELFLWQEIQVMNNNDLNYLKRKIDDIIKNRSIISENIPSEQIKKLLNANNNQQDADQENIESKIQMRGLPGKESAIQANLDQNNDKNDEQAKKFAIVNEESLGFLSFIIKGIESMEQKINKHDERISNLEKDLDIRQVIGFIEKRWLEKLKEELEPPKEDKDNQPHKRQKISNKKNSSTPPKTDYSSLVKFGKTFRGDDNINYLSIGKLFQHIRSDVNYQVHARPAVNQIDTVFKEINYRIKNDEVLDPKEKLEIQKNIKHLRVQVEMDIAQEIENQKNLKEMRKKWRDEQINSKNSQQQIEE